MSFRFLIPGPSSRFFPSVRQFLNHRGLEVAPDERRLYSQESGIHIHLARGFDIPRLVGSGWGDLGITGIDAVHEANEPRVKILSRLGIRHSQVVVASQELEGVEHLRPGDHVFTEYPRLAREYFESRGLQGLRYTYLSGAAEAFAWHPEVRCVITLCTSGSTIEANSLRILDVILKTEACLVAADRAGVLENEAAKNLIDLLTQ